MTRRAIIPIADESGQLYAHTGRYAREMVAMAVEELGGLPGLVDWARRNKDEFYTKLFPKIITREVDVGLSDGVESLLERLDAGEQAEVIDGEAVEL